MPSCETVYFHGSIIYRGFPSLIPSWQNAFSLSMSKGSYSSPQRPTLFRLQSNLFLHLNDLPVSLQAPQHLQCYIRLKLHCLKHSQGLHTLQNLQEVSLTGNLGKIGRWYQSHIFIIIIFITTKDLCKWFHFSLILIKISYQSYNSYNFTLYDLESYPKYTTLSIPKSVSKLPRAHLCVLLTPSHRWSHVKKDRKCISVGFVHIIYLFLIFSAFSINGT